MKAFDFKNRYLKWWEGFMQVIAALNWWKTMERNLKALQSLSIGKLNVFSFLCSTLVKRFFINTTNHYDNLITLHDGGFWCSKQYIWFHWLTMCNSSCSKEDIISLYLDVYWSWWIQCFIFISQQSIMWSHIEFFF